MDSWNLIEGQILLLLLEGDLLKWVALVLSISRDRWLNWAHVDIIIEFASKRQYSATAFTTKNIQFKCSKILLSFLILNLKFSSTDYPQVSQNDMKCCLLQPPTADFGCCAEWCSPKWSYLMSDHHRLRIIESWNHRISQVEREP